MDAAASPRRWRAKAIGQSSNEADARLEAELRALCERRGLDFPFTKRPSALEPRRRHCNCVAASSMLYVARPTSRRPSCGRRPRSRLLRHVWRRARRRRGGALGARCLCSARRRIPRRRRRIWRRSVPKPPGTPRPLPIVVRRALPQHRGLYRAVIPATEQHAERRAGGSSERSTASLDAGPFRRSTRRREVLEGRGHVLVRLRRGLEVGQALFTR